MIQLFKNLLVNPW